MLEKKKKSRERGPALTAEAFESKIEGVYTIPHITTICPKRLP
jgi:hypothetical protein